MPQAEQSQVAAFARDLVVGGHIPCIALIDWFDVGRRFVVGPLGVWVSDRLRAQVD